LQVAQIEDRLSDELAARGYRSEVGRECHCCYSEPLKMK
jgi:hypothetical protein